MNRSPCTTCGTTGRVHCYDCNGNGYKSQNCFRCGGRGQTEEFCGTCGGRGQVNCHLCSGTGQRYVGASPMHPTGYVPCNPTLPCPAVCVGGRVNRPCFGCVNGKVRLPCTCSNDRRQCHVCHGQGYLP